MKRRTFMHALSALALVLCILVSMLPISAAADETMPFTDVPKSAWYYHPVEVCWSEGLMQGVSATAFAPNDTVTREMMAMILYRIAGGEPVEYEPLFEDVAPEKWYTDAILWDTQQGLTQGIRAATEDAAALFGVGQLTTREQIVTFLYRYEGSPEAAAPKVVYTDMNKVSSWAKDAVNWAASENILVGSLEHGRPYLRPQANCTRAELATILMRYVHPEERKEFIPPEISATPVVCSAKATIDGRLIGKLYGGSSNIAATDALVNVSDLAAVWSGFGFTTSISAANIYTCTVTFRGKVYTYTNGVSSARYDGYNWYIPVRDLPIRLSYSEYLDTKENHAFYTLLPDVSKIPSGRKVPVLMYHAVDDTAFAGGSLVLFVKPENMEAQLKYIKNNGYSAIWFEDLPNLASYQKPVILTFDDGYRNNYTVLFPLLKKYQIKATIFIFPNNIGTNKNFLTWDMVKEMQDSGLVSFQSHTMSHRDLDTLTEAEQRYELEESKRIITEKTGKECFVLCFPTGKYNADTLKLAKQSYLFGLKMRGNLYTTGSDRYVIPRYYVSRDTTLAQFVGMIRH